MPDAPPPTAPPLFIVDAFADEPFTGNPAAVCLLRRDASLTAWPDAVWMQRVAEEMNLSETAFVLPPDPSRPHDATFGLRWFTPQAEVELCGHATLASAHLLFNEWDRNEIARDPTFGPVRPGRTVDFETRYAGVLTCQRVDDRIAMDFPAHHCHPVDPPAGLFEALRVTPPQVSAVSYGPYDFLIELDTPERVADLKPDFARLADFDARGVAVTSAVPPNHPQRDARFRGAKIVSRFFAPKLRIAEDPVTGSLHCVLATYWAERLGTPEFLAFQASTRGGRVHVALDERDDRRVTLTGQAFTVLRGQLANPPV